MSWQIKILKPRCGPHSKHKPIRSRFRSPEPWVLIPQLREYISIFPIRWKFLPFSETTNQEDLRWKRKKNQSPNLHIWNCDLVLIFDFWLFVWSRVSEPRVWSWWRQSGSWKSSRIFRRILPRLAAQVSSSFFALDPRVFLCLLFWCAWSVEKFVFDLDFVSDSKCFLDKFFRQK